MKLKNVLFTLFLSVSFTSIFANGNEDINRNAVTNFQKEFAHAENIQWSVAGPLTKATFQLDGEILYAYYSETGERVAVGRNIRLSQIPLKLMAAIKTSYRQYWISDAFELTRDNEAAYYVTLENADQQITLKSINYSEWMKYKTAVKH